MARPVSQLVWPLSNPHQGGFSLEKKPLSFCGSGIR
jgi:hypothetical protein